MATKEGKENEVMPPLTIANSLACRVREAQKLVSIFVFYAFSVPAKTFLFFLFHF